MMEDSCKDDAPKEALGETSGSAWRIIKPEPHTFDHTDVQAYACAHTHARTSLAEPGHHAESTAQNLPATVAAKPW